MYHSERAAREVAESGGGVAERGSVVVVDVRGRSIRPLLWRTYCALSPQKSDRRAWADQWVDKVVVLSFVALTEAWWCSSHEAQKMPRRKSPALVSLPHHLPIYRTTLLKGACSHHDVVLERTLFIKTAPNCVGNGS